MKLITCLLTKNRCYTAGKKIKPKGVMVHSTASNNKKISRYVQPLKDYVNYDKLMNLLGKNKYGNHWNRSVITLQKCVHAFIGELADGSIATVQTLPWDHRGWHGGKGSKGSVNDTHIGFEICEDNLKSKDYFDKVYREAVELTASLCKMYNLDPLKDGVVICHSEGYKRGVASNHGDVMHWFPKHGKTMDDFRKDVAAEMNPKVEVFKSYKVKINTAVLNVRSGVGTSNKIVTTVKRGEVFTIVGEENGWGKLKSGVGWISLAYTKKV